MSKPLPDEVATEALKQGDLSQVIDNDFMAKGKPYRTLRLRNGQKSDL